MTGRTLVMGDVHGNLSALLQCLERCGFDKSRDTLIQLGDVSDRHPFTAEVVEELLSIPSLVAIRGNHDTWTRDWLKAGIVEPVWLRNGGSETQTSYQRNSGIVDVDLHLDFFLNRQMDYYLDQENRLFIHAGYVHPKGPLFEQDPSICYWDRSLWQKCLEGINCDQKPLLLENFKEVFIGHTPTLNWYQGEPMNAFNVWNMDTGAGTAGKLSVMNIETKECWQSD